MDFKEFIIKYWLQFLLTLISTGLTALCRKFYKDAKKEREKKEQEDKKERERQKQLEVAVSAILHNTLVQNLTYYLDKGEVDSVQHSNILVLYNAYSGLGGNGTVKTLCDRFQTHVKIVYKEDIE